MFVVKKLLINLVPIREFDLSVNEPQTLSSKRLYTKYLKNILRILYELNANGMLLF